MRNQELLNQELRLGRYDSTLAILLKLRNR